MKKTMFLVIVVWVVTILACNFSTSTANISDAKMAKDAEGKQATTVFAQDDTFYCVLQAANAPADTKIKAVWTAVEADGVDPNFKIGEKELTGGGAVNFSLSNSDGKLWPAGKYKVELYLNDKLDRALEFKVEGQAKAAEPTATPQPEPTATPEPEPTPTPEPVEPTPTEAAEGSTGDTIAPAETEAEALPLQAPYTHPSGAFTLAAPEGWKMTTENAKMSIFRDTKSSIGITFFDGRMEFDETQLKKNLDTFSTSMFKALANSYDTIQEECEPDKKLCYATYTYQAKTGDDGKADMAIQQFQTVIYFIYLISPDYDQLQPTWSAVLDSYEVDSDAALAALESSKPTPAPTKKPAAVKPTPKPAGNPLAPPAGVARVYLQNKAGGEYYIDFGDGSGQIRVDPGAKDFYHDVPPGRLTPSISLFGGATANADFEIGPDQAWIILLDADGRTIRWGKVYPK